MRRAGSRTAWSCVRLLEGGGRADQPPEPRVRDVEPEEKAPVAALHMRDGERAGREPAGQPQAEAAELQEVVRGTKDESVVLSCRMSFSENRAPLFRDMRFSMDGQR